MKKLLLIFAVFVMTIGIVGCGGSNTKEAKTASGGFYKGKNVTMIVPWSAGGGTDTDARTIARV